MQISCPLSPILLTLGLMGCVIDLTGNGASSAGSPAAGGSPVAGVPTCALQVGSSDTSEGALYADEEVLLDGACRDAAGVTSPADLSLWFETSWRDADGQQHSERFAATGDTGDPGGAAMVSEADQDEARLFGFVSLAAGSHRLCLYAEDGEGSRNGDEACLDLWVSPANTPPRCELNLPLADTTSALGAPLHLEGWVWDPDQAPTDLRVAWLGEPGLPPLARADIGPDGRVSGELLIEGGDAVRQVIRLVAEDSRGARCTAEVEHLVADGPSVFVESPVEGAWLDRQLPVTLAGRFEDDQSPCDALEVEWRLVGPSGRPDVVAGPWEAEGCSDTVALDPEVDGALPEGDVRVYLLVTDEQGATNADMAWVRIGDCARDWYPDHDGDGHGDAGAAPLASCTQPSGYVASSGDCDDADPAVHPAASEGCNGVDDDCDGRVDQGLSTVLFFSDADGDGFGDEDLPFDANGDGVADPVCSDASLPGWTSTGGDCDDGSASVHPGAAEVCDGANTDEDCDGLADDADSSASGESTWYRDADGDGYGSTTTATACDAPAGYVANHDDCDDGAASIHPGATEVCDGANTDEDCDGLADDADTAASGKSTWYRDADGDSYGSTSTTTACDQPSGYVSRGSDCDDGCASCHPGGSEILLDGDDNDCDGEVDECGHGLTSCTATSAELVSCCIDALGSGGGTVSLDWSGESSFDETIELVSGLTLEGRGKSDTILRFTGDREDDLLRGYDTSDVTLRGFTLYGTRSTADCTCGSSGDTCDPGSGKSGDACDTESQAGIILKKDSGSGISDIRIQDVAVKYCWQYGLHIKYATNVEIDGLTASYNGYYRAEDHNVYLYRSDNVLITDSSSRYSAGHGINLRGCDDVVVHDTTVAYNHHAGLRASGVAIEQSDGSYTGVDSTDVLFDNTDSIDNDAEGIQLAIESGYNVHRACSKNSHIEGNDIGVEFNYVTAYQRSGNTYASNGTKESISSSSQDSSVCGSLPTSGFTWSY